MGIGATSSLRCQNLPLDGHQVSGEAAFSTARELAAIEGIPGGISSGAAVWAALQLASRPEFKGKRLVVIVPSFSERYLSTDLFADLRREQNGSK